MSHDPYRNRLKRATFDWLEEKSIGWRPRTKDRVNGRAEKRSARQETRREMNREIDR